MSPLLHKLKETLLSVLPLVIFVVILNLTIVPVDFTILASFLIGAFLLSLGLIILLLGVDLAILPFGELLGNMILKSNRLSFIICAVFGIGFFIIFAEPEILVLAKQVEKATNGLVSISILKMLIAMGATMTLTLGVVRIVKNFSLRLLIIAIYTFGLGLSIFASSDFFAIGFDATGTATGIIAVPIILAISLGIESRRKDSLEGAANSFGLVGVTAAGAMFGVFLLSFFINTKGIEPSYALDIHDHSSIFAPFLHDVPLVTKETLMSLLPVLFIFLIFNKVAFRVSKFHFARMLIGFFYTFVGLILFFVGVHSGFMDMGRIIGETLATSGNAFVPIYYGALLGILIILTEPTVNIMIHKLEDVTNGYIKRKTVITFLAIGMAFAVGLSILRIMLPNVLLWYLLIPGYIIALVMMYFTPKMFTGISFDAGAVASGPMSISFILAYSQGVSQGVEHTDVFLDSFGVIVMIALMPVLAMQLLGLLYKRKSKN